MSRRSVRYALAVNSNVGEEGGEGDMGRDACAGFSMSHMVVKLIYRIMGRELTHT
jgi:hypothetical protein